MAGWLDGTVAFLTRSPDAATGAAAALDADHGTLTARESRTVSTMPTLIAHAPSRETSRWAWPCLLSLLLAAGAAAHAADLAFHPPAIRLDRPEGAEQIVILDDVDGRPVDRTRAVRFDVADPGIARVSATGLVEPLADGATEVTATLGDRRVTIPLSVSGVADPLPVSFGEEVQAILTKHACNAGGCHGKAEGQNGFKLSLLGFDHAADHAAIVSQSRGRRITPSAPEASLLLLKATAAVPHGGGRKIDEGSPAHRRLLRWIAEGALAGVPDDRPVVALQAEPAEVRLLPGETHQLRVSALDAAGGRHGVTQETDFLSNAPGIVAVSAAGILQAGTIPGDAAILVRHLGHVATVRVVVPREGIAFVRPPESSVIDRLVHDRLDVLGIPVAERCDDATFLRRASLDMIGTLPTAAEARAFLADPSSDKREKLVERLLERPEYADFWTMKWADILRADKAKIGPQGAVALTRWLHRQFAANRPYDEFVRAILTADGPIGHESPAAVFKALDNAEVAARSMSQLFFGVRIECAQCHHHPSERWSQDDYAALAGFFTGLKLKTLPGGGEGVVSRGGVDLPHPRTGVAVPAAALGAAPATFSAPSADRRRLLAEWATAADNPFLARAIANRLWAHYFGRGLVEPIDDLRATNPATNEPLLDHLEARLKALRFDLRAFTRELVASRTYQLAAVPSPGAEADRRHFSHAHPKALPAEVLLDAICQATGVNELFNGWPEGTRAVEVWDNRMPSYFLKVFGRPVRATVCECERGTEPSIAQALHLINSPEIEAKLGGRHGTARRLAESSLPPDAIVEELCLATLSRPPTVAELAALLPLFPASAEPVAGSDAGDGATVRRAAVEDVLWTFLNRKEFLGNH
jgi:hypothetical protein